jgi:hypothetical protein
MFGAVVRSLKVLNRTVIAIAIIGGFFASGAATAQGTPLPAVTSEEFVEPAREDQYVRLPPGTSESFALDVPAGYFTIQFDARTVGLHVVISGPDGAAVDTETQYEGSDQIGLYSNGQEAWSIDVTAPPDAEGVFRITWFHQPYEDEFQDWGTQGWEDEEPMPDPMGSSLFGAASAIDGASVLDFALQFAARTLFPFLALFAVQGITIFFVLRSMMRPSAHGAETETLGAPPSPGGIVSTQGALTFHEVSHLDEVARREEARARFKRLRRNNAFTRWWLLFLLILLPAVTFAVAGPGMAPVVQIMLGALVWVLFAAIGRPLGVLGAMITVALMLAPILSLYLFGSIDKASCVRALAVWAGFVIAVSILVGINRMRSRKAGKQDLLVLRVFGMDRNANETFSTIAKAWSFVGASATIADPSFVRYQFSGMRGDLVKFTLVSIASGLAIFAAKQPFVLRFLPNGLSPIQTEFLLTIAAFLILMPFVIIPVFLSVQRNFMTDLQKLLARVNSIMGPKLHQSGYYPRRAFFCHDDMWRPAVHQMMQDAEVVMLDFRGFDPKNLGCAYEIGRVLDTVEIKRAVLVVDNATDTGALYDIFRGCWAQLAPESPNAGKDEPVLKVFITHPGVSMRENFFAWLVSALLLRRWWQWRRDSRGILALLATAGDQQSV